MNQEQVALSGDTQDPVLSGLITLETKVDLMSGLDIRLEDNSKLLKQIAEKLWITGVEASTGTNTIVSTGKVETMTGTSKGK